MNRLYRIPIVFIIIVILLFMIGSALSEQCSDIGSCRSCWSVVARNVSSDLCPGSNEAFTATCIAEPYQMQHNALVDVVMCGCNEAGPSFEDEDLNNRIEFVVKTAFGYEVEAAQLCADPGLFLSKINYG